MGLHQILARITMSFICLSAVATTASAEESERYLLKFDSNVTRLRAVSNLGQVGLREIRHFGQIGWSVAERADKASQAKIDLSMLRAMPGVIAVEKSHLWHAIGEPNDPRFGDLFGMRLINAPAAWDVSVGSREIVVAVSDTGIDWKHPDLANNIWQNPGEIAGNGIDDDDNGFVDDTRGWDFSEDDNDPSGGHSHGTHVAGTIGAEGNNNIGVVGVNWRVSIMDVRFLGTDGSGTTEAGIATLLYAADNGARAINCSWGSDEASEALEDAIDYAWSKGTLVVAAAGNDGRNTDASPTYPASAETDAILSVASVDANGGLSSFSNRGAYSVDVAAPGGNIVSTVPNGGYAGMSGTSMASPHVAGFAGLILSMYPEIDIATLRGAVLNGTAEKSNYDGQVTTAGIIDAAKALSQFEDGFQIWPGRLALNPGKTVGVVAYGAAGSVVEWSSEDPAIAEVDRDGRITGIAEGQTTITATDEDGNVASMQRLVVSVPPPPGGCSSSGSRPSGSWIAGLGLIAMMVRRRIRR